MAIVASLCYQYPTHTVFYATKTHLSLSNASKHDFIFSVLDVAFVLVMLSNIFPFFTFKLADSLVVFTSSSAMIDNEVRLLSSNHEDCRMVKSIKTLEGVDTRVANWPVDQL